jgi:hypothetical protein
MNPQEGFAQRDEGRNVEDPLWHQVMNAEAVEEQEATHEAMQWEAESQPLEVGEGNDLLVAGRQRQLPSNRGTPTNREDLL